MATKSRPKTEFPSPESLNLVVGEENVSNNRYTRFPAGAGLQRLSLSEATEPLIKTHSKREEAIKTISHIALKINPPNSIPTRPIPEMKIKTIQRPQTPGPQVKSPWDKYKSLHPLQRGGKVMAACTLEDPIKMVAIKKISSNDYNLFRSCKQKNLLEIIEAYRFEGQIFAVTNYTVTSLVHIIAIPLQLEEIHVSATCQQGRYLSRASIHVTNMMQVLKGMQYLSRFGFEKKIDSSKVLFSWDGRAKIGMSS
jgi:hypothetical protein